MSNPTGTDYDVVVLGCGTAGSRAAKAATAAGARVLAVDGADQLGGLCILRGCMPTKALLETAHRIHDIRDAERFAIRAGEAEVDFPAQMERMRSLVDRFRRAKVSAIDGGGYELVRANARFTGPDAIEVDGRTVRAKAFVIATGSKNRPLDAPGAHIATSDDMFELEAPPKRALVIGGGAVGLEFAQWLARIGSEVVLSVRSPLLHAKDAEIGAELIDALGEELDVRIPSKVRDLAASGNATAATIETADSSERLEFDLVLNAIGRVPNVDGLNLDAIAVSTKDGRLARDTRQRTNVAHVFAAGDVTGDRLILHEANREGQVAGHNAAVAALGGEPIELDGTVPPCEVIFTDPVFASVGSSRTELEREGVAFLEATKRFPQQGRGIVTGARHGLVRLLADRESGHVLGCQILNQRADDLIHIPAMIMTLGGTVERALESPWYHPTLSEAFIEVLREIAEARSA